MNDYVITPHPEQSHIIWIWREGLQEPYEIDLDKGTCTCPHFVHRKPTTCKHLTMARPWARKEKNS